MVENNIMHSGIRKIVITFLTQGVILVLSLIIGFILPKKMGTEMYGYWQIYVFYLAYLNFFGIGFNDGLTLFYSGYEYSDLPHKKIRSSMNILYIYMAVISCILFLVLTFFQPVEVRYIYYMLILNVPLTIIQCIVMSLFLSVNKTGIYNIINFLLRVLCTAFYLCLIFMDVTAYKPMIFVDFLARLIVTLICLFLGRKFLFGKSDGLKAGLIEIKEKVRAGLNITISAIAITFIPMAGKMIIQFNESASAFGLYSFAISLLHIVIVFTSTAGMVVFPLLKKLEQSKLPSYLGKLIFFCNTLVYLALLAYIPSVFIIRWFMPEYIPVLNYIHILLAMCIPLGKIQLVLVPYYKACRLEKQYFALNIFTLGLMLGVSFLAYYIFKSVFAIAIATTLVMSIWDFSLQKLLVKKIGAKLEIKDYIVQILMLLLFIGCASFESVLIFSIGYVICLTVYLILNINRLKQWLGIFLNRKKQVA